MSPLLGRSLGQRAMFISASGLPIRVNWTFFARCYGWGATSEYRLKIGVFAGVESVWPKISSTSGRPPTTILLVGNLVRLIFHII